ncbi:MAG: hypothetical protein ACKVZ0_18155 [Gemmatimonadales bacterium]
MNSIRRLALVVALVAAPASLSAQRSLPFGLAAGAYRVDSSAGTPIVPTVTRLEISPGKKSQWLLGAGVGFIAGAGITFAVLESGGSTSWCDQSANQDAIGETECLGLTVLGGAVGAGLGAIIGGMFRSERWREVPVERIRISLAPRRGVRFGLAMSY